MPNGYQVNDPQNIVVGASTPNGTPVSPEIEGYEFLGWSTEANGGDILEPGEGFYLDKDTTLYAQWIPDNAYRLVLNKKDGLNKPVSGVEFEINGESRTISSNGTISYNIVADQEYTIEETDAPVGYQMLEESFSFELKSNAQGNLVLETNIPDTLGNAVKCEFDSVGKTVNITVTNIGYFYIFYSSDCSVKEVPIVVSDPDEANWNDDGTYNIVNEVHDDYLYGGYYSDYAQKGDYQIDNPAESDGVSGATPYTGDQTSWNADDAITVSGFEMKPVAGETYFLKEVPNTYLHPATYVVYDTHDSNQIVDLYLLTATDDANYSSVGFDVTGTAANEIVTLTTDSLYDTVEVNKEGLTDPYDTLTAHDVFGVPDGLLALSEPKAEYIQANANYVEAPYFVTLDGVKVTGNQNLKVYLRNCHYVDGWKLPGITKIAQSKDIVNGAAN